jgi:hypothetical protein
MSEYGDWIIEGFRAGRQLVAHDMRADGRFQEPEREAHLTLQIGAEADSAGPGGRRLRASQVRRPAVTREIVVIDDNVDAAQTMAMLIAALERILATASATRSPRSNDGQSEG